jgi:hypothetical protein
MFDVRGQERQLTTQTKQRPCRWSLVAALLRAPMMRRHRGLRCGAVSSRDFIEANPRRLTRLDRLNRAFVTEHDQLPTLTRLHTGRLLWGFQLPTVYAYRRLLLTRSSDRIHELSSLARELAMQSTTVGHFGTTVGPRLRCYRLPRLFAIVLVPTCTQIRITSTLLAWQWNDVLYEDSLTFCLIHPPTSPCQRW